ncbi:hypothetical protein [Halorussus marinus]|uniref:hypothetical protein n=1 Tax=Halorussus marinus TaxID=2505976 RepID=UPI00106E35D3|nr:hypothetical protein [Halorussus marinus]
MSTWIDPKDGNAREWAGSSSDAGDDRERRPIREQAFHTPLPFQYETDVRYEALDDFAIGDATYRCGKLRFNGGVTRARELKLTVDGFLWERSALPSPGMRFKAQITRDGPPTDTEPFGEYEIWIRSRRGAIEDADPVRFSAGGRPRKTGRTVKSFERLPTPARTRLVELELIRNQPLAEYALTTREEWNDYATQLRFMRHAFTER